MMAEDLNAPCSVYVYVFPNGKRYYGIAKCVATRHKKHQQDMRQRPRALIHKMAIKYGVVGSLQPETVFTGTRAECLVQEVELIRIHRTNVVEWGEDAAGYNTSPGGDDHLHSATTGKKLLELLDEVAEFRDWYVNRPKTRRRPIKASAK